MCLKTRDYFVDDAESFLKHHKLFSMLICEIYNLLILNQPHPLTSEELFKNLSPFLQARLTFVLKNDDSNPPFFHDEYEVVTYISDLLVKKIFKISKTTQKSYYMKEE